jgi:hypothetical protein
MLVGRVIDANSGTALKAKLVFMDEDGNDHSVLINGKYRALLPAGKDLTLMVMVMSPDYRSQVPVSPFAARTGARDAYGHSGLETIRVGSKSRIPSLLL